MKGDKEYCCMEPIYHHTVLIEYITSDYMTRIEEVSC